MRKVNHCRAASAPLKTYISTYRAYERMNGVVRVCRYLVKIVDKSKVGSGMDRRTKSVTPNTSKIELNTLESNPNFLNILSNATISYL